jgi:hypothetical protein
MEVLGRDRLAALDDCFRLGVGISVVVGEQGPLVGGADLPVRPDRGGQGQQPLGDPDIDTGQGASPADAVATQDTVTQLVAAIRRVRRLVPAARGVALAAHDYDQPGKPACAWDDPQATQALVSGLVNDALAVLAAVGEVDLDEEQAEAVALLALVAGQDVEPGERPGSWQIACKVAKDRVISTVDPQARHTRKTGADKRDGYKAHIATEPETGLVTECALTAANAPDGPTGSSCWPANRRAWRC